MNNLPQSGILFIVPAFNEAATISNVVNELLPFGDVLVVDDGSHDNTVGLARIAGSFTISHACNLGYDAALESGIRWAVDKAYLYAITYDADGQHSPDSIHGFISRLDLGADVVVGIRSRFSRWSEYIFSFYSSVVWSISDPLCGMKAYKLSLLRPLPPLNTYPSVGTELCIRASCLGLSISQVNISARDRKGASRFGNDFFANMRILRALFLAILKTSPLSQFCLHL